MKSTSNLWNSPNTSATNSSGFSALPIGTRYTGGGAFNYQGIHINYWSRSEYLISSAFLILLDYDKGSILRAEYHKGTGFAIRCLKD